jgi:hypothetical protein
MMELLAGPATVARFGAGNILTAPQDKSNVFWDDELGIGSMASASIVGDVFGYGPSYFVTQLDGTCGARGRARGPILLDVSGQYEWVIYNTAFDPEVGATSGFLYGFDKQNGIYFDKPITKSPGLVNETGIYPQIRAADRILSIHGLVIKKRAIDGSDASWAVETQLTAGPNPVLYTNAPTVSKTKDPGIVCIIYGGGGILFYDVNLKQQVARPVARIGANNGAWYSVKFDIYVSCVVERDDWHVSVWANAVRPDSLSAPEAVTPPKTGKVSQLRVRLLGAYAEPCAREIVSWSIVSGDGSLTSTQSLTDADGYAYIGYCAPLSIETLPVIQASVEF